MTRIVHAGFVWGVGCMGMMLGATVVYYVPEHIVAVIMLPGLLGFALTMAFPPTREGGNDGKT